MLLDFVSGANFVRQKIYDVCVCGTGPAGITIGRKLAAVGKSVLLLEGGDLEYTDDSQDIYKGESVGRRYTGLELSRLRFFGGTSNHWAGRCGLLDAIDFERRDYFGMPGWPIDRAELLLHLDEAKEILDIPDSNLGAGSLSVDSSNFERSGFALSPPTRFAKKYELELRGSDKVDLIYNASLIDIALSADLSRVEGLTVSSPSRKNEKVRASTYVLAMGAIENARILLNCDKQVSAGIGNDGGMVGRCFMEHLNVSIGRFVVTNPNFWQSGSVPLVPTEALRQRLNIGGGILQFEPNATPVSAGRLKVIKQFLRESGCSVPAVARYARQIIEFDCPGDGLISSLIEQVPNEKSSISLIAEVDSLGLRRTKLNWQLHEKDLRTIRVLSLEAAKEMARQDWARVQLNAAMLSPGHEIIVEPHAHHMGTTRMSLNSASGVVDKNCKVHGINNLYVAGSSVFSTGGGTNPTLTVVLLALRLSSLLARG